jgi:hypothetical protein
MDYSGAHLKYIRKTRLALEAIKANPNDTYELSVVGKWELNDHCDLVFPPRNAKWRIVEIVEEPIPEITIEEILEDESGRMPLLISGVSPMWVET